MTRAIDVLHNHLGDKGFPVVVVYAGFSRTAPSYHVFKCLAESIGGLKAIKFDPLEGPCSILECPSDEPRWYCPENRQQLCDEHAASYSLGVCPYTSIVLCRNRANLPENPLSEPYCMVCEEYEGAVVAAS